jgi:glycosyltransferase involved in cell wall biosynthesis
MHIAIIGTRGIPNHYGGFEQFAEHLATGLVNKGHAVTVYNSHTHPYKEQEWNGVEIRRCYDPERKIGTFGQFIYDLNCVRDLRRRQYEIILQLGYASGSVWGWLLPRNAIVTTNMDGLEWKRTKFSKKVQAFLRYAEKLAVKYSDHMIADSTEIQRYIEDKYHQRPIYIPYAAELFDGPEPAILSDYEVTPFGYDMLVARMEPENSIEMILDGVVKANTGRPFLVIGGLRNKFASYLLNKFRDFPAIRFLGGIYNIDRLNNLRYHANLYFHGHTVGGTNPSLLEAMASNCLICANDNLFNRAVTGADALYFQTIDDIANTLSATCKVHGAFAHMLAANREKIATMYNRDRIVNAYEAHFESIIHQHTERRAVVLQPAQGKLVLNSVKQ